MIRGNLLSEYARVCAPKHTADWTSTEFLMRNIINPITHGISMVCFLTIAIVYFVMPTLKDLVGNIVTTICISLIISQAADMTRLLTVFTSHVSMIIAGTLRFTNTKCGHKVFPFFLLLIFFFRNCLLLWFTWSLLLVKQFSVLYLENV